MQEPHCRPHLSPFYTLQIPQHHTISTMKWVVVSKVIKRKGVSSTWRLLFMGVNTLEFKKHKLKHHHLILLYDFISSLSFPLTTILQGCGHVLPILLIVFLPFFHAGFGDFNIKTWKFPNFWMVQRKHITILVTWCSLNSTRKERN